jgi:hypothetical protein
MAIRRTVRPNPQLTKQLRTTVTICAEVMAAHEAAFTEAMTDVDTRKEYRQVIADLEGLVAGIQHREQRKGVA